MGSIPISWRTFGWEINLLPTIPQPLPPFEKEVDSVALILEFRGNISSFLWSISSFSLGFSRPLMDREIIEVFVLLLLLSDVPFHWEEGFLGLVP